MLRPLLQCMSPLVEVKRTFIHLTLMSAFDPKRTLPSAVLTTPVCRQFHPLRCLGLVRDHNEQQLAYAYFEDDSRWPEFPRGSTRVWGRPGISDSYCSNPASAVSTRVRSGVGPNCESIRFASVRCASADSRLRLVLSNRPSIISHSANQKLSGP